MSNTNKLLEQEIQTRIEIALSSGSHFAEASREEQEIHVLTGIIRDCEPGSKMLPVARERLRKLYTR
jgi:hypothetical protein